MEYDWWFNMTVEERIKYINGTATFDSNSEFIQNCKVGDRVYVVSAETGAYGAERRVGILLPMSFEIEKEFSRHRHGVFSYDKENKGIKIKINDEYWNIGAKGTIRKA